MGNRRLAFILIALTVVGVVPAAAASSSDAPRVRVDLISDVSTIAAGDAAPRLPAPHPTGSPLIARARRAMPSPSPWPASFAATAETVSVAAGQPVKTPITRAYGCTVKYA